MEHANYDRVVSLLETAKDYVQIVHDRAEIDIDGGTEWDKAMYNEIMDEAKTLLQDINETVGI